MPARLFFLAILLSAVPVFATSPASFDQISKQAEAAQKTEHLPDAIRLYQQGLRLKPTWTADWWSLGSIFYDQDRYPEARQAFEHFVRLSPKPGPDTHSWRYASTRRAITIMLLSTSGCGAAKGGPGRRN